MGAPMIDNALHATPHPLAGKTVLIHSKSATHQGHPFDNQPYRVEDWWDRASGGSWKYATGNPAAIHYAIRSVDADLPFDDEVVYGKLDYLGYLLHVSELGEVQPEDM